MTQLYPAAGCKFYIGGPAVLPDVDMVVGDFSAVSWTQVTGFETMGAFGDASALITTPLIDQARDIKQKGTKNAGQMQNNFAVKALDAGQVAMIAAEQDVSNYYFKVELNDKPSGGSTNSTRLFVGLVTAATEQAGGANNTRMLNTTVEINSNIVRVAAT